MGEGIEYRSQVDGYDPSLRLDELRPVVEHPHDLLLRGDECRDPRLLEPRALQELARQPLGQRARSPGDGAGEPLLVGGKALFELGSHVDVREQLVGQRRGDLLLDRRIGDQLSRGLLEVGLAEGLPLHEVRRDRDDDEQHAEHCQEPGHRPAPAAPAARRATHTMPISCRPAFSTSDTRPC